VYFFKFFHAGNKINFRLPAKEFGREGYIRAVLSDFSWPFREMVLCVQWWALFAPPL